MKCKYCGADVTLDDHFCPHCGRAVEQAQRHQEEMQQYEAEFEQTKKAAMDKISVTSGGGTAVGIRLALICALIAALIWMFVSLDPYMLNERREKRAAAKNHEAYTEQMETYLGDRDYAAFSAFCDTHKLDYNNDYKEYRYIIYEAFNFKSIYRGLLEAAYAVKGSQNLYYAGKLSDNLNNFYEQAAQDSYKYAENVQRTGEVYEEMEEELGVLLKKYLKLSDEETASLKGLSKSRRTVVIEQALDKVIIERTGTGLNGFHGAELPQPEKQEPDSEELDSKEPDSQE